MGKEQQNVYVVEMDMKEKSVEDIAREAALQIIGITDALIEQQKEKNAAHREQSRTADKRFKKKSKNER